MEAWFAAATEGRNTSASGTPSGLLKPALNPLSAARATVMTTPWPRPSTGYTDRVDSSPSAMENQEAVEFATLEWVSWFNHQRLLEPIGYIPPAEAEANYYRQLASHATSVVA